MVKQILTVVGFSTDSEREVGSHVGEVTVELLAAEERGISSTLLADKWRDLSGDVPEALELVFMTEDIIPVGKPIEVRLMGDDFTAMREAAARLEAELGTYPGVLDIGNDFRPGKMEIQLALKPAGRVLGITLADLARQVNQGFHGAEALRLQRGRDDVRVMIRYPEAERRSLGDLDNVRIRTPKGGEVPFGEVAAATLRRGFAVIKRADRQRALNVTAEVDSTKANAEKVLADLEAEFLPRLLADYENMRYSFEGQHKETQRSVGSLFRGFAIAMLLVYAILAVIFRSYAQPLVVMSVIPFGLIGAVAGHFIMGHVLSLISMFGLVALSGVLVNDSLVLVDFINRARSQGTPPLEAVLGAGRQRFPRHRADQRDDGGRLVPHPVREERAGAVPDSHGDFDKLRPHGSHGAGADPGARPLPAAGRRTEHLALAAEPAALRRRPAPRRSRTPPPERIARSRRSRSCPGPASGASRETTSEPRAPVPRYSPS